MDTAAADSLIRLHDLAFEPWISAEEIKQCVETLASGLRDQNLKNPLFLGILQGSFVFMSDLVRAYGLNCQMDWMRVRSYEGTSSTESLQWLASPRLKDFTDYDLIIVEDIIDTGFTLHKIYDHFKALKPQSLQVVSLLRKPEAVKYPLPDCTIGMDIEDHFVVGYGLDYNELGRNIPSIYRFTPTTTS